MKFLNKIVTKTEIWYEGKYIPNFMGSGHFEKPLLAKILKIIGNFWLKHWQFIISTILAAIALYITWLQVTKTR